MADPLLAWQDRLQNPYGIAPRRRPQQKQQPLTPEEEESLLRSIGSKAAGGLGWLGETLDKPGRAVRGTLSALMGGEAGGGLLNLIPFSDTFGLTDPAQGVGGRDLLETAGILGPNQEGKLDPGDVAGFGAEVLLDPLTYLTLGGSALTKAGRAAKAAGLTDDLSRVQRMRTTLDDAVTSAVGRGDVEAGTRVNRAMAGQSGQAWDEAAVPFIEPAGRQELGIEKLGGLFGVGLPFMDPWAVVGKGKTAEKIAGKLDALGETIRYGDIPGTSYSPGRHFAQLFEPGMEGLETTVAQKYAKTLKKNRTDVERDFRSLIAREAMELGEDVDADQMWRWSEGIDPNVPPQYQGAVKRRREFHDQLLKDAHDADLPVEQLRDAYAQYAPRRMGQKFREKEGANVFWAGSSSQIARKGILRDLPGGTASVRQVIGDKGLNALIDSGADPGAIRKYLEDTFPASTLPRKYVKLNEHGGELLTEFGEIIYGDRLGELSRYLPKLPKALREEGLFANHPTIDLATSGARALDAIESAKIVQRAVLEHGKDVSVRQHGDVSVRQLFKKLKMGQPDYMIGERVIPKVLAEDLLRVHKGFTSPKPVKALTKAADSFLSLFKAGVLTHPAYHVRNLTSAMAQSWFTGQMGLGEALPRLKDAWTLLRGGDIKGASKIPEVAAMLKSRGIAATDNAGTDIIREMAYATRLTGHGPFTQIGTGPPKVGVGIEGVLEQIPGIKPRSMKTIGKKLVGMEEGTTWNPFDVHGVSTLKGEVRDASRFGPVAASADVSYLVDGASRLAPFIAQLRKGIDSATAAAKVTAAQVDYGAKALTTFERERLARLFPFYRFTKGAAPFFIKQLAERPGGKLPQFIRGVNEARDPSGLTPDYVAETSSIRVPEGTWLIGAKEGAPPRYVTGLGLMFEDPAGFVGSGIQGTGLEILSRANPLIKGPIEYLTGVSAFQKGPEGGRPLEDLDPLVGRLLSNVTGQEDAVQLPTLVEQLVANSPASRLVHSARTATDARKGVGGRVANLLTGLRVTDVSESAQDAILREEASKALKSLGGRDFEKVFIPADRREQLSPAQQAEAARYQQLLQVLGERAKSRAKKRKLASAGGV